jgi:hypothetical protein
MDPMSSGIQTPDDRRQTPESAISDTERCRPGQDATLGALGAFDFLASWFLSAGALGDR